ncbi:Hint domain-containing protein, partial [Acinetobacter sp.]|uniref:Hint domain-containing protein n=1 Tax=Acinetobacter sp. TaxID=472 RepID=UPI0035B497F7
LEGGKRITATDGHPFRTSEGWRDAVLLKKGAKLLLMGSGEGDGSDKATATATIEDVRIEVKTTRVYNLEVENLHTFFVGVQGLVVHNGGGVQVPCGTSRAAFRKAKRDANIPTSQTHNTHRNGRGDRHGSPATDYFFDGNKTIQKHPAGHPWSSNNGSNLPHFNNHQPPGARGGTGNHYTY